MICIHIIFTILKEIYINITMLGKTARQHYSHNNILTHTLTACTADPGPAGPFLCIRPVPAGTTGAASGSDSAGAGRRPCRPSESCVRILRILNLDSNLANLVGGGGGGGGGGGRQGFPDGVVRTPQHVIKYFEESLRCVCVCVCV